VLWCETGIEGGACRHRSKERRTLARHRQMMRVGLYTGGCEDGGPARSVAAVTSRAFQAKASTSETICVARAQFGLRLEWWHGRVRGRIRELVRTIRIWPRCERMIAPQGRREQLGVLQPPLPACGMKRAIARGARAGRVSCSHVGRWNRVSWSRKELRRQTGSVRWWVRIAAARMFARCASSPSSPRRARAAVRLGAWTARATAKQGP